MWREARRSSWLPNPDAPPPKGLDACVSDIGVAVIETDASGCVLRLNAAAERLTGWTLEEKHGAPLDDVFRLAPQSSPGPEPAANSKLGAARPEYTALLERRDGQVIAIRHVMGTASPRTDAASGAAEESTAGRLVVFRDVNMQHFLSLQLARRARYDLLTGLLNRQAIAEHIDEALEASRTRGVRHALCYFNLDRFRLVNSTCGHDAGDHLLQWVATRMHEFVGPHDTAGRIGGDEFVILLAGRDTREAEQVARELLRRLLEFRFGWEEKTFSVGASIGLVFFGVEFKEATDVLSAADHACRMAKENGRGRLQIYLDDDKEMSRSRRALQWVASIQQHLADGRLRLYAQSIHPLAPRKNAGAHFEVLVRVVGDDGQLQSPVGIIRAAEHSGLMHAIDRFVIRQAFAMIGALPRHVLRRLDTCSINLSGVSLVREGLLDFLVEQFDRSRVSPRKICFEITETATFANLGEVLWLMQELGAMGCRFAIDDFGSGHASYGYLESLPVHYVKIDGIFVRDFPENPLHRAIVESVHRIGCTLGIETVAECVETQLLADMLAAIGIDYAQGWLYGKPQPLADVCAALCAPQEP
jgi:diguanylate cyclase (GGDEF)-like protein